MTQEAKGTAVQTTLNFVRQQHRQEGLDRWLEALPAASRAILGRPILSSVWYPAQDAIIEPLRVVCELFFRGDSRGAWQVGRFSADESLTGIYKVFVKLGSPRTIVERGTSLLARYYRPASMVEVLHEDHRVVRQVRDFEDRSGLLGYRIGGFLERGLEISGALDVTVALTRSWATHDDCFEYDLRWSG